MNPATVEAIGFATAQFEHHSGQAESYRAAYIGMIVTFLTGLAGSIGFWLSREHRQALFPAYAAFVGLVTLFVLIFQSYWWFYHQTSLYWAREYRGEAMKLITQPGRTPFAGTGDQCDPPLSWLQRKRDEVIDKWNGVPTPLCERPAARTLPPGQITFWLALILVAGCMAIVVAGSTRRGSKDVEPPQQAG